MSQESGSGWRQRAEQGRKPTPSWPSQAHRQTGPGTDHNPSVMRPTHDSSRLKSRVFNIWMTDKICTLLSRQWFNMPFLGSPSVCWWRELYLKNTGFVLNVLNMFEYVWIFWICFTQNCHFPLKVSDIGSQLYSIPCCCINTSKSPTDNF